MLFTACDPIVAAVDPNEAQPFTGVGAALV